MQKQYKDLLRTVVVELRHTLIGWYDDGDQLHRGDLDRELERLGVGREGGITPLDALPVVTAQERRAHRVAEAQLTYAAADQRPAMRQEIVERAAYTWINRLLALRAMEARGLIDETLRPNPAYDGIPEALFIQRHTDPPRSSGADGGWWAVIEAACRAQAASLPGLFDLDDPNAALRPSTPALLKCVSLVGGPPASALARGGGAGENALDPVFRDPDAIGWAYQFYQEEAKARTYAKLGGGGKVETRSEIAAVTQLFTEPYMVQWLLQNSLGRSYHELYPDSRLPATWAYYIRREGAAGETRRPGTEGPGARSLAELTFMDPCMGSGHFEREAFDMLAAMYREQHPEMDARAVADRILDQHLHGIDIDPRAAQLAALTLTLRAWELVANERRQRGLAGPGQYRPPRLNFATTPTHLTPGALARHLQRHPDDRPFEPVLRGVFEALEQAPILGSLLKPGEHLDQALAAYRKPGSGVQMGLLDESASLNHLLEELARHDPGELKRMLLARISRSFAAEAGRADDVGAALFGREAGEGVRLLQLLEGKYAVVATNPPYMGSGVFSDSLKQYVLVHYEAGRRDLYAAFVMRCLTLCQRKGRAALVTQQNWMFSSSLADFRAQDDSDRSTDGREGFAGMLRQVGIETLAHLGPNAFSEISGEVVKTVLMVCSVAIPKADHELSLVQSQPSAEPEQKAEALKSSDRAFLLRQSEFIRPSIGHRMSYWIPQQIWRTVVNLPTVSVYAKARKGVTTMDNHRFVRWTWESCDHERWQILTKSLPFSRWTVPETHRIDWSFEGARIKTFVSEGYGGGHWSRAVANVDLYFSKGCWCSIVASGSPSFRILKNAIFETKAIAVIPYQEHLLDPIIAYLNSHFATYLMRALSPGLETIPGAVEGLPIPEDCSKLLVPDLSGSFIRSSNVSEGSLPYGVISADTTLEEPYRETTRAISAAELATILPLCIQAYNEDELCDVLGLSSETRTLVYQLVRSPAAWHAMIEDYDILPETLGQLVVSWSVQNLLDHLTTRERIHPTPTELARIKANLRTLYEAGPGAKTENADLEDLAHQGDEDEVVSGAYIPIPTETFLEELSVKLQIHPISVYWLLEELRADGVRCQPEERRLLEDRLSVLVLRLLGHRWPRQLEAGEPVPPWADRDGIIPLTAGTGEATVADRLRQRLRAEDGPLGAQRVEALLEELTGQPLATWLRKTFFERHTRQFKRRPVAWQLASTPVATGKKKAKQLPAFECLLYYHACGGDVLARIRTQHVEPLLIAERRRVEPARRAGDDTEAALTTARIHELEDFAQRLRQVEERGFAGAALDELLAGEPLDRWSGDGVFAPGSRDALLSNERAWRVDINDGVRVNVAPLQVAGLLAGEVLNKKDLSKAIADRARWRSDERRWVRAGKLPRCGWMDESVPESPAWTELAPAREAERVRLEEKRKAVLGQMGASSDSQ